MTAASVVVPSCNTGLKSSTAAEGAGQDEALCIDFLALSADAVCFVRNALPDQSPALESMLRTGKFLDVWATAVLRHLFGDAITHDGEVRGFRHFYDHHLRLKAGDAECGWIAVGGDRQRGTFAIQLTGAGCAHVTEWAQLAAKLQSAGARLTRVDVAYDDFTGAHSLAECRALYEAGAFVTNGRPPALGEQGWSDKSGWTLYVGKNAGNQQLCVYEKGKQLGDAESPWVRWEGRFGAKYRDIPLDVLLNPAAYLLGHFPALSWIDAVAARMRTHVERAAATLKKSIHWCRHQYGGLLEYLRRGCKDRESFARIVETLSRPTLPQWARELPHGFVTRPESVRQRLVALASPS